MKAVLQATGGLVFASSPLDDKCALGKEQSWVSTVQAQLKRQRIVTLLWPLPSHQEARKPVSSVSQIMEIDV